MPTTRRQSQGVPSSGPSTPQPSASSAIFSPLRRSTRAASRTPSAASTSASTSNGHEHHQTADELAMAEAQKLVGGDSLATPTRTTRSQSVDPTPTSEAHALPVSTRSTRSTRAASKSPSGLSSAAATPSQKSQGRLGSPAVELILQHGSGRKNGHASGARTRSGLSIATSTSDGEDEEERDGDEAEQFHDAASQASHASAATHTTHASSAGLTTGTSSAFVDGMIGSALHSAIPSDASVGSAVSEHGDGAELQGAEEEEPNGVNEVAGSTEDEEGEDEDDASTAKADSPHATPQALARDLAGDEDADDASSSDDDSDSEDDSEDSASSSEADSDADDDDESDEEDLERLLAAARQSAQKKVLGQTSTALSGEQELSSQKDGVLFFGDESVLTLDKEEEVKDAPIPRMSIPTVSNPSLTFGRPAQAGPSRSSHENDKGKGIAKAPLDARAAASATKYGALPMVPEGVEMDTRAYERTMTKREKAAQPKKASTSELWSTLPSTRSDLLPQMKRDYQALALANSLDPKRFMKGGGRANKVPEHFAIGTVIEQSRKLQSTTLQKEKSYRPGQLVQGIAADEGVGSYAKRKFGDLQYTRMENGRGKGWKKRSKW